jgi:hypothetical protein
MAARRAAPVLCLLVVLAGAAPADAAPVKVVSHAEVLDRAGVAPIAIRCRRAHRACRGSVTLGVPQRHLPVACSTCLLDVGAARFLIPAGRTRAVTVRRAGPADVSDAADSWDVVAVARLRGEKLSRTEAARRHRSVRLEAPAALPRPAVPLALVDVVSRWGLDSQRDDDALRFRVRTPRATGAVRVEIRGRTVDLHPDMTEGPYVVPAGSFAPAGTNFHGELPIAPGEYRYGERYPVRVTACRGFECEALEVETEVSPGAYGYGDPICRLPRTGATAAAARPAVKHPSPLAVLLAAPGVS